MPGWRRRGGAERGARRLTAPAGGAAARGASPRGGDAARRFVFTPAGTVRAPWRLALYLLALAAGGAVAGAFVQPALYAVAHAFVLRPSVSAWVTLAAAAIAHLVCLRLVERRPWAAVRLGRCALRPRPVALGWALGMLAVGVPTALLLVAGAFRVTPAGAGSSLAGAASLLGVLAPAALFEELLVRGYPFLVLRESVGPLPALLLTSLVFGLLHLQNPGATVGSTAAVTLAGIFLGGVLLATGSLWAAFSAHLAWNWTLAALFHAVVSGLPFAAPDYRVVDAGPDWLTGGGWGPEGGAGAVAGMLGALAFLHWRADRGRRAEHAAAAHTAPRAAAVRPASSPDSTS